MANAASGVVSMKHGLRGQSFGTVSACSAGAHAIGMAARLIRYGDAETVVTGGSEAAITPLATAAFSRMDALSDSGISRPFDKRRDGFVMGEGAGILVLEEEEAARARGARILGYLRGYASTSDAHHLTAPEPSGRGRLEGDRAGAGRRRSSARSDVLYVNAHGTSTPLNDRAETNAIKAAFGEERAAQIPVSSTKSAIGHLLGAAGRGRGDRDAAGAARPDRAADAQLRGARRGARPRLRAAGGAPARQRRRAARSASRTRSGSAGTTPCSAWRPSERSR